MTSRPQNFKDASQHPVVQSSTGLSKNKTPALGNAMPVLGAQPKQG